MRYIRTKEGIYEIGHTTGTGLYVKTGWFIRNAEIIDQADTIEELCDEFVGVDKTCENGHQLLRALPTKCGSYWSGGVYGAIWTNKGLIYVAKMNSEGVLELI